GNRSATCLAIARASRRPRSPLQTLEQPLLAMIVCRAPLRACSMETSTGAPFTWLVVKTAAERAGDGEWMRARSFRPDGLMPATTPLARMPGTAVTPPSSHSMSPVTGRPCCSGGHRRSLEAGPLAPAAKDVEVLHAVGGTPLAEIVDRGYADGTTGARIGDNRHVAVVAADDCSGRRALALAENAHERLARVELAVSAHQLRGPDRSGQRHRRRREEATRERQQMWRERHADRLARKPGQLLLHLCRVTV